MDRGWLELAVASLPVAGAIVVAFVPRWAEVREARRTRYAESVQTLVAWTEFPYRVARRVGDAPEILEGLAVLGHDLQENVVYHKAWVTAESRAMGRLYSEVTEALRAAVGPAIQSAWGSRPVTEPDDMNIGSLGMHRAAIGELLNRVAVASQTRFGWRRLLGGLNGRREVFAASVNLPMEI